MSCKVDVSVRVKSDILDCDADARREIGNFLVKLQDNPCPKDGASWGSPTSPSGYLAAITSSGKSLEIDQTRLARGDEGISIRILGVGRATDET